MVVWHEINEYKALNTYFRDLIICDTYLDWASYDILNYMLATMGLCLIYFVGLETATLGLVLLVFLA